MEVEGHDPPPVPPKDTPYKRSMDPDALRSTPASGSKRKRPLQSAQVYGSGQKNEDVGEDGHTPKRTRPATPQPSEKYEGIENTPHQRTVRRKKKNNNLSHLNLRHAAAQQDKGRGSKFQEGSLTDKPSEKPPSSFTHITGANSAHAHQVDDLMSNYHKSIMMTPRNSIAAADYGQAAMFERQGEVAEQPTAENAKASGLLGQGRSLAATLYQPIALWKQLWNETKEELKRQDREEAARKRALKAEAERKYAAMKSSGLIPTKSTEQAVAGAEARAPRDSGIVLENTQRLFEHERLNSEGSSTVLGAADVSTNPPANGVTESSRTLKTFKSTMHLKKPSLSNLKFGLKRTASELNLAGAAEGQRDSSSSVSPRKVDYNANLPTLRKTSSRYDVRKQHKLSKRVSDLESKLQKARQELDEAIQNASPTPKFSGKNERFTPGETVRDRRFVPGLLPTLPSERLFSAELLGTAIDRQDEVKSRSYDEVKDVMSDDGSDAHDAAAALESVEDMEGDETIKARRPKSDHGSARLNVLLTTTDSNQGEQHVAAYQREASLFSDSTSEREDLDNVMDSTPTTNNRAGAAEQADEGGVDVARTSKFKQLDANIKIHRQLKGSRKRKSGSHDAGDLAFTPNADNEDGESDSDDGRRRSKRNRKSEGVKASPASSQQSKTRGAKPKKMVAESAKGTPNGKKGEEGVNGEESTTARLDQHSEGGCAKDSAERDLDELTTHSVVEHQPLEPVYEDDEQAAVARPSAGAEPVTEAGAGAGPDERRGDAAGVNDNQSTAKAGPATKGITSANGSDSGSALKEPKERKSFEWPADVF